MSPMNAPQHSRREPAEINPLSSSGGAIKDDLKLTELDRIICSKNPILYNNEDFKDDRVVGKFVAAHHPLQSAVFDSMMIPYTDPCICCIPAYGQRHFQPRIRELPAVEAYIGKIKAEGTTLDLLLVSENLYHQLRPRMATLLPEGHLIVSCDRQAPSSASALRIQGIPAIDFEDYMRCAPLNAVIALTCFKEMMAEGS